MAKLTLKFGSSVQKEVFVGNSGVRIGRSPDNNLMVDNFAVSHHHARVFFTMERQLMLEDLGSLNGTLVNGRRVNRINLRGGDVIAIGKHTISIDESNEMEGFSMWRPKPLPVLAKVDETMVLSTEDRKHFLEQMAAITEPPAAAPASATAAAKGASAPAAAAASRAVRPRAVKFPKLVVRKGRTTRPHYHLTDRLTVIGRSSEATVQLRGWFTPRAAAQINRRDDSEYYLGCGRLVPLVNGHPAVHPTKLVSGDIIDIAGARFEFVYSEEHDRATA